MQPCPGSGSRPGLASPRQEAPDGLGGPLPKMPPVGQSRPRGAKVLALQGPPGSGKTRAASRLIRALLDAGKKVGVTATSHAVIGNVLQAVDRPALQKCDEQQACGAPGVEWSKDAADVEARLLAGDVRLV